MMAKKAPIPMSRNSRPGTRIIKLKGKVSDLPSQKKKNKGITKGGNAGAKYDTRYMLTIDGVGRPKKKPYRPDVWPKPGLPKRRTAKLSK